MTPIPTVAEIRRNLFGVVVCIAALIATYFCLHGVRL